MRVRSAAEVMNQTVVKRMSMRERRVMGEWAGTIVAQDGRRGNWREQGTLEAAQSLFCESPKPIPQRPKTKPLWRT